MGVMRDPDTKPEVRVRIARTVVPFVHPKQKRDPKADMADAERMDELGDEFMVDPELAARIHEQKNRLGELFGKRVDGKSAPEESKEKVSLQESIDEMAARMGCPEGYGPEQVAKDKSFLSRLSKKRKLMPPHNGLTEMERVLETQAIARLAAHETKPEQRVLRRLDKLSWSAVFNFRDRDQYREEYQRLRASLPPDLRARFRDFDAPPDPDPEDPLHDAILHWWAIAKGQPPPASKSRKRP